MTENPTSEEVFTFLHSPPVVKKLDDIHFGHVVKHLTEAIVRAQERQPINFVLLQAPPMAYYRRRHVLTTQPCLICDYLQTLRP